MGNNIFNEQVGLLKSGTIVNYDQTKNLLKVKLNSGSVIKGQLETIDVPAAPSLFYNNGLFIGSVPAIKTPIVVGQGSGGQYYSVSTQPENLSILPKLIPGELLIRSNDKTKITINVNNTIDIGSNNNKIHVDTSSNLITINFDSQNKFTQGSRKIDGVIKRDLNFNTNFSQNSKLESDAYDKNFTVISLDPKVSPNSIITSSKKNPPLIEQREMIYEFEYKSDVQDDLFEASLYSSSPNKKINYTFPNRRLSRADTLSLSLVSPNYLMETIKGTVVDIFGNILDLNRFPLPIGQGDNTLRSDKSNDKSTSFINIKEIERKSLAYHFEINARKDLSQNGQLSLPDINSNTDNSRGRSRFFIDIDKEGQFKINVPASSEKGNIPLLTRYENYSTFGSEDNNNPNKLIYREDNLDIFLDSFAANSMSFTGDDPSNDSTVKGSISIKDGTSIGTPIDRILGTHIKHGTAHHDILKTCYSHQTNQFLDYQTDGLPERLVNIDSIPLLENIVSDTIFISGDNANAGGRSGSINFDGSLELNIGANTSDRQSLWLDTAGGIVANIGRDKNNRSGLISMNGDLLVQIGGIGITGDSRFVQQNNGQIGAVVDLRVFTDGLFAHLIRLDKDGISIMTPGNMSLYSKGSMKIGSATNLSLEAESLFINGRMVLKEFGGSI